MTGCMVTACLSAFVVMGTFCTLTKLVPALTDTFCRQHQLSGDCTAVYNILSNPMPKDRANAAAPALLHNQQCGRMGMHRLADRTNKVCTLYLTQRLQRVHVQGLIPYSN